MVRDKSMKNDMVNNRIASEKEFEEVFRYYYRPLFLFAYGYVMDEEEASEIDVTFNTLMGDKVEPRRDFIEANAKYVQNLDI